MNEVSAWLETSIRTSGYIGVFILMVANGVISFPSSQILYLVAGYLASMGLFSPIFVAIAGALGNAIGNALLYELTVRHGATRALRLNFVKEKTFDKLSSFLGGRGIWFIFFGKLIPAVKVIVPIAAGLARSNRLFTYLIFFIASLLWAGGFLALGYIFGKSTEFISSYIIAIAAVAIIISVILYQKLNADLKHKLPKEVEDTRTALEETKD